MTKFRMEAWYWLEQRWWGLVCPFWKEGAPDPPLSKVGVFFYGRYHKALRDIYKNTYKKTR